MKVSTMLAIAALSTAAAIEVSHEVILGEFASFMKEYERTYKDEEEYRLRLSVFEKNYKLALRLNLELNNGNVNGSKKAYGITQFTDMTEEEKRNYINYKPSGLRSKFTKPAESISEDISVGDFSFDWREKGYVADVVNQGQCGSCWAFSTAFGVESAYAMKNHGISSDFHLSPQQLVDCEPVSYGCNGGDLPPAFDYLAENGMALERDYPYTAKDGTCVYNSSMKAVDVTGYQWVVPPCDGKGGNPWTDCNSQNEADMVKQIAVRGPAAICVAVSNAWFQYTGPEPFTGGCDHGYYDLNHCVGVVGWKASKQVPGADGYWIIRNSWGTTWGDKGYMYIPSSFDNSSEYNNYCGVASEAAFATIA